MLRSYANVGEADADAAPPYIFFIKSLQCKLNKDIIICYVKLFLHFAAQHDMHAPKSRQPQVFCKNGVKWCYTYIKMY
jgi:hypothetical protein